MARSGQGAGEPPQAIVAEGSSSLAPRPGASGLDTKMAWGLIGLGLVGHMLRSPRFYETVAVAAIAVGSLRQIGQQNTASTMARLQAWNQREMQRLERKAQRQARGVKGVRADGTVGAAEGPGREESRDLTIRGLAAVRGQRGIHCRRAHGQLGGHQVEGGGDAQAVVQAGGHRGRDRWRLAQRADLQMGLEDRRPRI